MKLSVINRLCRALRSARPRAGRACAGRCRISERVRSCEHGDGMILLALDTGSLLACNRTGRQVWEALANCESLSAITAQMSRESGASEEWVQAGVNRFIEELSRLGLVTP